VLALKSFVTAEHAKKICRIKIAEEVKLCSAILCKTMQYQKYAQKDELKNAQDKKFLMDIWRLTLLFSF
jgi:hypothetical protein